MDKSAKRYRERTLIGRRLHRARVRADLSLRAVGALSGVDFYKWRAWEKGKSSIPAELLMGVAAVVDLTAEQLLPSLRKAA